MDLQRLGEVLRDHRQERNIPRTRLARQVGVSPSYLWMVEEAKPRATGQPSRPSRHLLGQLGVSLRLGPAETRYLLQLGGYGAEDADGGDAPSLQAPADLRGDLSKSRVTRPRRTEDPARTLQKVRALLFPTTWLGTKLDIEFAVKDLRVFSPTDPLIAALVEMEEHDYSQVVVRVAGDLCLLTLEGVIRRQLLGGTGASLQQAETPITVVLPHEVPDAGLVLPGNATVREAVQAFSERPLLKAIIVTSNGSALEMPIGIVTPWDLVEYSGRAI